MLPTIEDGQKVYLHSLTGKDLERWELVLIEFPSDEIIHRSVRRVLGVPGDKILLQNGSLFINDEKIRVPTKLNKALGKLENIDGFEARFLHDHPNGFLLKPKEYFLIGDNLKRSLDSRYYGPVSIQMIKGKVTIDLE